MKKSGTPWSVPVAVEDIPDSGLHLEIEAPAAVRAELAELAELRELSQLSAVFDLIRQGADVQVSGRVNSKVGQICVVTLEPIESAIKEAVELRFAPPSADRKDPAPKTARKRSRGGEEPPEPLVGGVLDLGALATEFLILGIDPYPRKTGVRFAPPNVEDAGEKPFAVLEELKKRSHGGQP